MLRADKLEAVADRGYFNSTEILECHEAGITVTLPKPMTSGAKSEGRFGKQDFVYVPSEDIYRCPAGERLTYRYSSEEEGKVMRIPKRCEFAARRSSIRSEPSSPAWARHTSCAKRCPRSPPRWRCTSSPTT